MGKHARNCLLKGRDVYSDVAVVSLPLHRVHLHGGLSSPHALPNMQSRRTEEGNQLLIILHIHLYQQGDLATPVAYGPRKMWLQYKARRLLFMHLNEICEKIVNYLELELGGCNCVNVSYV